MNIYPLATINGSNVTTYSSAIQMNHDKGFGIGIEWTGDLVATVTLQLGMFREPGEGGILWGDITDTFPAVPAGVAGASVYTWEAMNCHAVRFKVVRASGEGTFRAYGSIK